MGVGAADTRRAMGLGGALLGLLGMLAILATLAVVPTRAPNSTAVARDKPVEQRALRLYRRRDRVAREWKRGREWRYSYFVGG